MLTARARASVAPAGSPRLIIPPDSVHRQGTVTPPVLPKPTMLSPSILIAVAVEKVPPERTPRLLGEMPPVPDVTSHRTARSPLALPLKPTARSPLPLIPVADA